MLTLRDPADPTNDLGRKAIAIKHVQATFRHLCAELDRAVNKNTRPSLLEPLVGTSYGLTRDRRERLRAYGSKLSTQLKLSLAQKAKMVRDREIEQEKGEGAEEEKSVREEQRDAEFIAQFAARNQKIEEEAGRTTVLEHGEAMASILGMPTVDAEKQKWPRFATAGSEKSEEGKNGHLALHDPSAPAVSGSIHGFLDEEPDPCAEKGVDDDTVTESAGKASG